MRLLLRKQDFQSSLEALFRYVDARNVGPSAGRAHEVELAAFAGEHDRWFGKQPRQSVTRKGFANGVERRTFRFNLHIIKVVARNVCRLAKKRDWALPKFLV